MPGGLFGSCGCILVRHGSCGSDERRFEQARFREFHLVQRWDHPRRCGGWPDGQPLGGDETWNGLRSGLLTIDLQYTYEIEQIILTFANGGVPGYTNIYNLYKSFNATDWTLIGSGTLVDTEDHIHVLNYESEAMRYIKYEVVGGTHWANLSEMEAFSLVPEPAVAWLLTLAGLLLVRRRRTK
jgi:hypothetical protein